MVSRIRWAMLLITTPGLPVVAMMSMAVPSAAVASLAADPEEAGDS